MSTTALSVRDALQQHAKAYGITPGQEVTLLLGYVALRQMFPEIPFSMYLERTRRVAGADAENRKFAKDALDYHCPNKGSAWPPKPRIEILLRYIEVCDLLWATDPNANLPLDVFLASEAPVVMEGSQTSAALHEPPAASPAAVSAPIAATVTPVAPQPPVAPPPPTAPVPGQSPLRIGPGVYTDLMGVVTEGMIYRLYSVGERQLVGFLTHDGKVLEDAPASQCASMDGTYETAIKLRIPKAQYTEAMKYLASPGPVGTVPVGQQLLSWELPVQLADGETGTALVQVYNATPRPLAAAAMIVNGEYFGELRPRTEVLAGYYPLVYAGVAYVVEVVVAH